MTLLTRARILIADDQLDVARTLCDPIKRAGAIIDYAEDGEQAYGKLGSGIFDILIVDMKMPPGEWGGLWLLKRLRDDGWKVPVLVLSGEGTKRQIIQALRLGADDWIDKFAAEDELSERCLAVLRKAFSEAVVSAVGRLPTVLAYRLAAYSRAVETDKRTAEGLRSLEAILRFTATVGLCSTQPRLLPGVRHQIARPTMGTWLTLCVSLAKVSDAGNTFVNLLGCLMPDGAARSQVQEQIRIRNAMAHSGYSPSADEVRNLNELLTRFAHRANSIWRSTVAVPTSMTYDGSAFTVSLLIMEGANPPQNGKLRTTNQLRTGQPVLIDPDSEPTSMFPWFLVSEHVNVERTHGILFDGVKLRKSGSFQTDSPLVYVNLDTGEHGIQLIERNDLVWSAISSWMVD